MYTDNQRYLDVCANFADLGLITDIVRVIKRGKEGAALLCRAEASLGAEYCVVKIFKDEQFRNFKNDRGYLEGKVWKRRDLLHLVQVKSELWVETEFNSLKKLHAAGLPVPKPYDQAGPAVCMEFIGEGDEPAPMLKNAHPSRDEAAGLFEKLIGAADGMLAGGIVHGDLSPFNILYHRGAPVIIDFPQSVPANTNRFAFDLFCRDVESICEYFSRFGIEADGRVLAEEIWGRYYII